LVTKKAFIDELTTDLHPAPSLLSPPLRSALWFYLSLAVLGGVMYVIQPFRDGALTDLLNPRFLVETLLPLVALTMMAFLALLTAIPGVFVSKAWQIVAFVPLVLFILSMVLGVFSFPSLEPSMVGKRPSCFLEVLGLSWIAVLFIVVLLRRAFVFQKVQTGLFVGLASAAIPMTLMQVACMYQPQHALTHHVAPALVVGVLTTVLAPLLFWKKDI